MKKISIVPKSTRAVSVMTWCLRVLVGCVFIFSGFVKAVDPWGSMYKFQEYFSVWGLDWSREIVLMLSSALSIFEFSLGVMLLLGCFRKVSAILYAAFMGVMTALTLYIYVKDPVSDCGCFGDAFVISNGATFLKNILLSVVAVFLLVLNHRVGGLIKMKLQWLGLVASISYASLLGLFGYHRQPLVDFRPFPVGEVVSKVETDPVDTNGMKFVYEKDGVREEFEADELPDESWTFVERVEPELKRDETDLIINDEDGEDVTSDVILPKGNTLLMVVSNPQKIGLSRSLMAKQLAEAMHRKGGSFATVIASDYPGGIPEWRKRVHVTDYDVYESEDTDLKMLVRGDMALVYITDGIISWKYNLYTFEPDFGDMAVKEPSILDEVRPVEKGSFLFYDTLFYLIGMALIIGAGPLIDRLRRNRGTVKSISAEPKA